MFSLFIEIEALDPYVLSYLVSQAGHLWAKLQNCECQNILVLHLFLSWFTYPYFIPPTDVEAECLICITNMYHLLYL